MANSATTSTAWQQMLNDQCTAHRVGQPVYQTVSDRRGGRTAWSSSVMVNGQLVSARFWYDGSYINNSKEDAAECALRLFGWVSAPQSPQAQQQTSQWNMSTVSQ